MSELRVDDVMTRNPRTVTAGASLLAAYECMSEGNFRHLPVVDGRKAVGILSDRDVLRHMPPLSRAPFDRAAHGDFLKRAVVEIMTQGPLSVPEGTSLEVAVELMLVNQVSAVLVVDDAEALRGILTMVDAAGVLLRLIRGELSAR